ncbi:L-ornithine N5-monooxygenase [Geosmithia morbida]|uniref:L-ornithine N(5)-monooxygenase [NAD(P)H] n=1 Tax=Geosmithia morbida TaxID=1094350 RepID=A0A9P5CZB7_9HYPO|nr:L-ornithine N5-monooxygenase [Geosmithia morbida]KAF4121398.1 L-ornithine N5-monooxygenase [Geosmithia morbida]
MAPHSEEVLEAPTNGSVANGSSVNGFSANGSSANGSSTNGSSTNGSSTTVHNTYTNGASSTPAPAPVVSKVQPQKPQYKERSAYLTPSDDDSAEHDLICVGFGPASLAIAVAMHDALAAGKKLKADGTTPRVLFIEKQTSFSWHAGMLLPGARMQISFIKDLATLRDPRSEFTFLNYLHRQGRLVDFTNLSTFLPARAEYEDYMRWAASFFDPVVRYGNEVLGVTRDGGATTDVKNFVVETRNIDTGRIQSFRGRNIVFATGGQPSLPPTFPQKHPRVIHSSQYAKVIPHLLPNTQAPYRVAVVGAGQSAAEIFHNVQKIYPNSQTRLIMRQEFLRPSDDSPFVNSVFNPEYIDLMFPRSAAHRHNLLAEARATNYGVVRLELIEELYETMYHQRRVLGVDSKAWPHQILGGHQIKSIEPRADGIIDLHIGSLADVLAEGASSVDEAFEADLVIAATGYKRTCHVDMLRDTWSLLPKKGSRSDPTYSKGITGWDVPTDEGERKMAVDREYRVRFKPGAVAEGSGVYLQGCCEGTHGLSDTLLSVLSTRSGEMVESIFGKN